MNTLILEVTGINIENFIYKLHHNNIEIIKAKYINRKTIRIEVYYKEYEKIKDIKGIYDIKVIKYKGLSNIIFKIKYHKFIIISIIIGIVIFNILSNLIYDIEISYSGKKIRELVENELKLHGLVKYSFAKRFDELENIKNQILIDEKDYLEWLMIERVGTKYIIKLEPKKINKIEEDDKIYNVVTTKDIIIKKIEAKSGEIIKSVGDFAKKGDIIISSDIKLYDEVKKSVSASGKIYGEVWYKVNIEYPLKYYEISETGNRKITYNIKVFDRYIGRNYYKNKKVEDKYLLSSEILPIALNKQTQIEYKEISYDLGYEEAIQKAMEEGRNKIKSKLKDQEYIIDEKKLKCELKDSKIVLDMFYTVYEDVTGYVEIEEPYDIQ